MFLEKLSASDGKFKLDRETDGCVIDQVTTGALHWQAGSYRSG